MKTWWHAVCDEHKEFVDCVVNNPVATVHYLNDKTDVINAFLNEHWSCKLKLRHTDSPGWDARWDTHSEWLSIESGSKPYSHIVELMSFNPRKTYSRVI